MKVEKDPSKFLSAEDVSDQEIVILGKDAEEVEGKYGMRLQIGLTTASGDEKVLTLNPTSKANLIDTYGDETNLWNGKEARVHIFKSKVGSEIKNVLYLTSPNKDMEGKEINA